MTCRQCTENIFPRTPVEGVFCSAPCRDKHALEVERSKCSTCGKPGARMLCDNDCGFQVCADGCWRDDHACREDSDDG
jgi:hypothetical protein